MTKRSRTTVTLFTGVQQSEMRIKGADKDMQKRLIGVKSTFCRLREICSSNQYLKVKIKM